MNKKGYTAISGAAAVLAGFICGFIGSGGGMFLLLTLTFLQKKVRNEAAEGCGGDTKDVYAVNIAAVVAMSAVSAVMYFLTDRLPLSETAIYIIPAAAGGLCGAVLLDRIKIPFLNKILAAVTIYAGIKMMF